MSTDRWDQRRSPSDRVMLRPLPTSLVIRSMIFVLLQGFVQDLQSRSFGLLGVYGAAPCAVYALDHVQTYFDSYDGKSSADSLPHSLDFDFDAAVFGATFSGLVVRNRLAFAKSLSGDPAAIHALLHDVIFHRPDTPFRQALGYKPQSRHYPCDPTGSLSYLCFHS